MSSRRTPPPRPAAPSPSRPDMIARRPTADAADSPSHLRRLRAGAEAAARSRLPSRPEPPAATGPSVTVVVCTRNRAEGLRGALESLARLDVTGLRADVLVVDNGSTDHTAAVVVEVAAASPIPVRRVFEATPGVAHARQRGVTESRGEWIASFDDDQLADPNWLRALLAQAEAAGSAFVGGRVVLALPAGHDPANLAPFTRMLLGASVHMPEPRPYDFKTTPGAGNMMARREVFDRVGPFDPALDRGEDTDFFHRALAEGFAVWYTPDAVVHHCIPPERMNDAYLYRLCDVIGNGTAERDLERFGRLKLPAMWVARLGQAGLTLLPRWVWAKLFQGEEAERGRRCRLRVARRYLIDAARYAAGLPVETPA